ncbi:MAG: TatD family hydrolase [Candidatus Micrarchaeaceae archaeon]
MAVDLFDSHCHIQSAGLDAGERATRERWAKLADPNGDAIMARAHAAGVSRMLCVGCDAADSELAIDFVKNRENCWASIGIHPHESQHYAGDQGRLAAFAALAKRKKVVAVGECGLDYFYTHSPKETQIAVLRFQIELAQKHDLPMVFHVRDAFDDFWPIFEERHVKQPIRGVLHSFTDSQANMRRAIDHGLYIGVNGIATFSKDPSQQAMYKAVPLEYLLLETDAPFLTPYPYRGSICEPYHVRTIAEFLSWHRGEPVEQIAEATTQNTQQLFRV